MMREYRRFDDEKTRAFFLIENIFRVKFPPDDDRNYVHKN